MTASSPDPVQIRYSEGERGWAIPLGDGRYRIDNIPMDESLRYGDVVTVKETEHGLMVDEIMKRAYPNTISIKYLHTRDYDELRGRMETLPAVIEGFTAPSDGRQGLAQINYADDVDIETLLEGTSARVWE